MEKEATINSLFGETIYCTNVDNDNQTIAKHIESFVKEKPGRTAATTDVKGKKPRIIYIKTRNILVYL